MSHQEAYKKLYAKYNLPDCSSKAPGLGWFSIVETLIQELLLHNWNKQLYTIKEKYGILEVQTGKLSDRNEMIVNQAISKSYKTCEICGKPGKMNNDDGCDRVRCKTHMKEENV